MQDKYILEKKIGSGSYGSVYIVHHSSKPEKKYVLKKIPLKGLSQKEKQSAKQEVKLLQSLQHPFIVRYIDSFLDEDSNLCIVMSYCKGGDIANHIQKNYSIQKLPEKVLLKWFIQTTLALHFIHSRKVLHRDLKSQNIFLSENGNVKLGDFGIARVFDSSTGRTCEHLAQTTIGTPLYMSPEQCNGSKYSYKSDIWSLGVILYEMVNQGALPFKGKNIQLLFINIQKGYYTPIKNFNSYTNQIIMLIRSCLQTRPSKRPNLKDILTLPIITKFIRSNMLVVGNDSNLTLATDQMDEALPEGEMNNLLLQLQDLGVLSSKPSNLDPTPPTTTPPGTGNSALQKRVDNNRSKTPVLQPPQEKILPKPLQKINLPSRPSSGSNRLISEIDKVQKEKQRLEKILELIRKEKEEKKKQDPPPNSNEAPRKPISILPQRGQTPYSNEMKFNSTKDKILFERQRKKALEEEEQKVKLLQARKEYHQFRVAAKNQHYQQLYSNHFILPEARDANLKNGPKVFNLKSPRGEGDEESEYEDLLRQTTKKLEMLQDELQIPHPEEDIEEEIDILTDSDKDSELCQSEDEYYESASEFDDEIDEFEDEGGAVTGRLEDRAFQLQSQCESIFGKERFSKLYEAYKQLYNSDQMHSKESKDLEKKEILGDESAQLGKYCQLIEELIFVQSALI
ncbi:hypothetical protein ABK040_005827 [Willaertia magna]